MKLRDLIQLDERTPEPFYPEQKDTEVEFDKPIVKKFEEIDVFGYICDAKVTFYSNEEVEIDKLYFAEEDEETTPEELLAKLEKNPKELAKVEDQLFKLMDDD